jgi:hypothetical protein
MLTWSPQLHLSVPCVACVWGMVQNSQWMCGCRHMSQCAHHMAVQGRALPAAIRCCAPTAAHTCGRGHTKWLVWPEY